MKEQTNILNNPIFSQPSITPIIDKLVRQLMRMFILGTNLGKGEQLLKCSCGAYTSDSLIRYNDVIFNGLAIHILALHRSDVLQKDIDIINEASPEGTNHVGNHMIFLQTIKKKGLQPIKKRK